MVFDITRFLTMISSNLFGGVVFMFLVAAGLAIGVIADDDVPFAQNYYILYGPNNVEFFNQSMEVQLSLDQYSGSGFGSINNYSSGFFQMRIKIPNKDSSCFLTTFYLKSYSDKHDELDFEFYGGNGLPYQLQTNVYANGVGGREQKVSLWFDPTVDFHTYQILWNQHEVVFFVDNTPIRVFKNNTNIGVSYPGQPMRIEGTIWEANWSCPRNKLPDWSQAPFRANYQGFGVEGCQSQNLGDEDCYSSNYWWNEAKYWDLDAAQNEAYEVVRSKYLSYDYCTDKARYPNGNPECKSNEP